MFDVAREDIVEGPLARTLVLLAVPLVVQNFALVAQQVIDLFWVGRLGSAAVAAVGIATVVIALVIVPLQVFFLGGQVVTSQRVGAEEIARARRVPFTAAAMAVGIAVALGAGVFLLASDIVGLFGAGRRVSDLAVTYLSGYALALVTTAASDALESGFTGWGDTRAALSVNVVAIVVNLVLDPFLIFGWWLAPELGIAGAALATAVGYACGALFALGLLLRGREGFRLTRTALRPAFEIGREIVEVGAPIAGQNAGRQVARLLVVGIVSAVAGGAGLAAYYLGWQVATLAFVPPRGLGRAATSVVGQSLGAERPDRARRVTWIAAGIAAVGLAVVGALQWLFPATIAHVFVPDMSGRALEHSITYLEILAYGYPALGAIYTLEAGFNGAGRTEVSMYATLLQYWTVRLPIAAVGAFLLDLGVIAVFWAVTLSNVAAALGLAGYYWHSSNRGMLRRAAANATAD